MNSKSGHWQRTSRGHKEKLAASSKTTHSHLGAMPWNSFNPSFSLSRDSSATDDDTTVTKEGWNSDPNCYSPQLGSYAQETLLVNTSLSNTQLQAALWTKWGSGKESERREWGGNLQWLPPITAPQPRNTPGDTASPSDRGHGHTVGKHQIQLCRMGFGFWGPQLCSAVMVSPMQ